MHTQILVLLASESVKFLHTGGRTGLQQEDSDMVKVRPLLLSQQRRSNTSITHKDLTEGSFCHGHKMLLSNSHFIIKHRGPACAPHLAGAHGLKPWANELLSWCQQSQSFTEAQPSLSDRAARKQGMRAAEGTTRASCRSAGSKLKGKSSPVTSWVLSSQEED